MNADCFLKGSESLLACNAWLSLCDGDGCGNCTAAEGSLVESSASIAVKAYVSPVRPDLKHWGWEK